VETLQNAMVAILKSQQLRNVLVYTTLLLIFATAWVIYRWPAVALPAMAITGVLLCGEALLIYFGVKRLRHHQH
jgi:hypothetical protein